MGFDIEHQLARGDETEDVKPPPGAADEKDGADCCSSRCCSIVGKTVEVFFIVLFGLLGAAIGLAGGITFVSIGAGVVVGFPVSIPLGFIIVFSLPKETRMRLIRRVYKADDDDEEDQELGASGIAGMYARARFKEQVWERIMMGSLGVIARVSLGALVLLGLSLLLPRLRAVTLIGSPMWKWSLLGVTLTAGYFQALTLILPLMFWPGTGTTFYYLNALLLNINHVTYFGLVLGAWLGYFRTHHGLNHSNPRALEYVTWTFVSLFVGSILLLFKNLLLLKWSADAIYRRFEPRILITSLKFYFIGRLAAGFDEDGVLDALNVVDPYGESGVLKGGSPTTAVSKYVMSRKMSLSYLGYVSRILTSLAEIMSPMLDHEQDNHEEVVTWFKQQIQNDTSDTCTPDGLVKLFSSQKRAPREPSKSRTSDQSGKGNIEPSDQSAEGDIEASDQSAEGDIEPSDQSTKGEIGPSDQSAKGDIEPSVQLAKGDVKVEQGSLLLMGKFIMPGEQNMLACGIQNILMLATCNRFIPGGWNPLKSEAKKESEGKNKILANVLWRLVGEESLSAHAFTFDDLKIWMVDAHKDCINMGRTLSDAKAIVTRLDIFMSFNIFVVVLLLWLLITGVSSTTVLVTVATPFLALTFIFGDSAKTFFQGFIFCFATHPFDVGDRCLIDGVELEVRSVSILTTTFIKIGSKEKRLYPNSILATIAIVNLGWQPDPKDVVELPLSPSTDLDALEKKITRFFEEGSKRYGSTYNMMISEVGENIKVIIHFSHILTVHDLSHSQCFKKKSLQRSIFLSAVKKYVNESQTKQMDANNPSQSPA